MDEKRLLLLVVPGVGKVRDKNCKRILNCNANRVTINKKGVDKYGENSNTQFTS